jgi:hypothetical protein
MNIGDLTTNKIKIENEGIYTKICIDGKEIPRVRSYELSQCVGEVPVLTLEIMPDIKQIELEGEIVYKYYDLDGNELVPEE